MLSELLSVSVTCILCTNQSGFYLFRDNIGYPIAECAADGKFILSKPPNTGGLVSPSTVAEQVWGSSFFVILIVVTIISCLGVIKGLSRKHFSFFFFPSSWFMSLETQPNMFSQMWLATLRKSGFKDSLVSAVGLQYQYSFLIHLHTCFWYLLYTWHTHLVTWWNSSKCAFVEFFPPVRNDVPFQVCNVTFKLVYLLNSLSWKYLMSNLSFHMLANESLCLWYLSDIFILPKIS